MSDVYDVAVVGGGHNGLTAAAYLAKAGKRVIVLERETQLGGAAVSARPFPGIDARLSRYSYLVSLLPQRIIDDLGLGIRLASRRYSSCTPLPGTDRALLIDDSDAAETTDSFASVGALDDAAAWRDFVADTAHLGSRLFPSMLEPLQHRHQARAAVGDDRVWNSLVEQPIGSTIQRTFASDLVRGVVLTDALIGTFAPVVDETLAANRCFLYHVIGQGTGRWDVPVGGMGSITGELARAALMAGASLSTESEVTAITPDGEVLYRSGDGQRAVQARWVLSNVAPTVLERLLSAGGATIDEPAVAPEGAQIKSNLLLRRLPRLRSGIEPAAAFAGTLHINETWSALGNAYDAAVHGALGDPLPVEVYCHTLTDDSILSQELRDSGAHTLTAFALQAPHRLGVSRDDAQRALLASLDSVLAEPIESVLMTDADGRPCIETRTTADLEVALGMPGGNIFHGPLSWPFAEDDAELDTPAKRWGVATPHERVLICGSASHRGGAVSGIGGHNAAMAVLEVG
ncbi:phytoene desaturase family protein [Ruicaihuangia caeni]|uniref:NAD(P)/FAD-dependent oxidoreductase n=1 Tax=Ruicaihuangia caeni TaxID=3042517 RepID=A0AAW6TC96_9MICO|nr:NAD(P)/FAD-dependent oxidoreductase [Klugiella sp. YN-L-19]MDI2098985.1 NAD(P)/FAD-dependent oxidoreductase [Klugiella sp. YN-L-19]